MTTAPQSMSGRPASPTALSIHAGSTGNAAHDILDVSPVNLIVIATALKCYLIAV